MKTISKNAGKTYQQKKYFDHCVSVHWKKLEKDIPQDSGEGLEND